MCMCRLTVISRRDAIRFANTRNMVASSVPLVASAYPPEGFRLMSDADAVCAWLASFRGTIATADYATEMIDAGYKQMAFLVDKVHESMKSK